MKYDKLQTKQNQAKNLHFLPYISLSWKKTAIMTFQHHKRKSMEISPVQANILDNLLEIVCKVFITENVFHSQEMCVTKLKTLIMDFSGKLLLS